LLALAEVRLPPLTSGPNLHVHANEDEMFLVLDGVMTVQVADEVKRFAEDFLKQLLREKGRRLRS
jgi:uncharacterized cupin superfamily protein